MVTAHTGLFRKVALGAAVAVAAAVLLAPPPAAAAPNDACAQALAYEKTAASESVSRQAAYDSAVAGLTANTRCTDPQMKLVNEAYLLSMRAPAEHELKIGDWRRDLSRANMLLTQCTNWPGLRNTKAGIDCATQRRYNDTMVRVLTAQPSPAPAASAAPAASGAPSGPPRSPMPLPTPPAPNPSPTPRR